MAAVRRRRRQLSLLRYARDMDLLRDVHERGLGAAADRRAISYGAARSRFYRARKRWCREMRDLICVEVTEQHTRIVERPR